MNVIEPGSFSEWVWQNKYRLGVESVEDTFTRVANSIAFPEKDFEAQVAWSKKFYDAMRSFEFIPAGRILAGAGTQRNVTLINCFVSSTIPDSMDGIMSSLKNASLTLKAGGGIGMDFSTLRPRGAHVAGVDSVSSGAVSFMELWNTMCGTIMSAGARRGAMMGVLRVDHPDIEEFIEAKQTPGRLTNFNISVAVTDAFMDAVRSDGMFPLEFGGSVYRRIRARELWEKILRSTYEFSEPGVIFIDRVNERNPLRDTELISATNPCGEQCLPPDGACVLGSINLARLVRKPFDEYAEFDSHRLRELSWLAVRFLDNVVDQSRYPLDAQHLESQNKRRIGIGITGLADALIMLGVRYGSDDACEFVRGVTGTIAEQAMQASIELADEKGPYPLWQEEHGPKRRNSHLMSIAPTGTISAFAGYVSGGIEPVFAFTGRRNVLMNDGTTKTVDVEDYAHRICPHKDRDPNIWVTADDVSPEEHVLMLTAAQKHIDSAVSKTINCPKDIAFDEFKDVYSQAYELGAKGCTTYRPSPTRGAVLLKADEEKTTEETRITEGNVVRLTEPAERPDAISGVTYKIKPSENEHAIYVTINDAVEDDGRRRPFEIFFNSKNVDSLPWMQALSRMISAVFRRGGDVSFVAEELQAIHDPKGGFFENGSFVPSHIAAIGDRLAQHCTLNENSPSPIQKFGRVCPKCGRGRLVKSEGCEACDNCDYTKC